MVWWEGVDSDVVVGERGIGGNILKYAFVDFI